MVSVSQRCPFCHEPLDIPKWVELPWEVECANIFCPLHVKLKLFATQAQAEAALEHERTNLPKRLSKIMATGDADRELSLWGYTYRSKPVRCFLLRWLTPLVTLVTEDILSNIAAAVSHQLPTPMPFTFFSCDYDSSGTIVGLRPIEVLGVDESKGHIVPGFCKACRLVRKAIKRYNDKYNPGKSLMEWYHPCHDSDLALAKQVSTFTSPKLREIVSTASAVGLVDEYFGKFWHICWLGFADVAIPIYTAGELVGFVFTGQKFIYGLELDAAGKDRRDKIFDKLEMTTNERQAVLDALQERKREEHSMLTKDELLGLWSKLVRHALNIEKIAHRHYSEVCTSRDAIFADVVAAELEERFFEGYRNAKEFYNKAVSALLKRIADFFCFSEASYLERYPNGRYRLLCSTSNISSNTEFDLASVVPTGTTGFFPTGKVPAALKGIAGQGTNAALVPISDTSALLHFN